MQGKEAKERMCTRHWRAERVWHVYTGWQGHRFTSDLFLIMIIYHFPKCLLLSLLFLINSFVCMFIALWVFWEPKQGTSLLGYPFSHCGKTVFEECLGLECY